MFNEFFGSVMETQAERAALKRELETVEQRLIDEMRARGFDPSQHENLALPGPLAKLYAERENLRARLDELKESEP